MLKQKSIKLATVGAITLSSLLLSPLSYAAKEIKAAFNQSDQNPQYLALKAFGEKFEAATDGRYKLNIFPNELLGDQRASLELVQSGAIQMAIVANPLVENYNNTYAVLSFPYIYRDYEHQKAVFTTGILDDLFQETTKLGFEVTAAYTAGARSMYTKDGPINTVEDMKGKKIRVMQSDSMIKTLSCMGGVGVPMGQGEVYSAIQQGVLNGAENNEITYYDLKQYEVAGYYSATRHLMVADLVVVNSDFISSMTEADQEAFRKLAKESTIDEFDLWQKSIESAKKLAEEKGAKFNEVDISIFSKACSSLQEELIKTPEQKALFEKITSL